MNKKKRKFESWLRRKAEGLNPGWYLFPTINIYEEGVSIMWFKWIKDIYTWVQ